MGESSVGKSFTLDHLMDTSFAGSAPGTTGLFLAVHELNNTERCQRGSGCPFHLRRIRL